MDDDEKTVSGLLEEDQKWVVKKIRNEIIKWKQCLSMSQILQFTKEN